MLKLSIKDKGTIEDFLNVYFLESIECDSISIYPDFHSKVVHTIMLDSELRIIKEMYFKLKTLKSFLEQFSSLETELNHCGDTVTFIIKNNCIEITTIGSSEYHTIILEDKIMLDVNEIFEVEI